MRRYWLLNQHGADGPTALVETDGRMKIIDISRFGPDLTELDAQQKVWDDVIGRVGPTMKPFVDASSIDEPGVAPHADLNRGSRRGVGPARQAVRDQSGSRSAGGERSAGGPSYKRSRGDR